LWVTATLSDEPAQLSARGIERLLLIFAAVMK